MSELKCPYNYKFGKDYDKMLGCEICSIWEKCINDKIPEWKRNRKEKENEREDRNSKEI